jgi:hypothetical protein
VSSLVRQIHNLAQLNKQMIQNYRCDFVVISHVKKDKSKITICLETSQITLLNESKTSRSFYTLNLETAQFSINTKPVSIVRIHLLTTQLRVALDGLKTHHSEIYGQLKGQRNHLVSLGGD